MIDCPLYGIFVVLQLTKEVPHNKGSLNLQVNNQLLRVFPFVEGLQQFCQTQIRLFVGQALIINRQS